jgi:hypothetical protein
MTPERAAALWTVGNAGARCNVTGRDWEENRYLYRVELEHLMWDKDRGFVPADPPEKGPRRVARVVREALKFFDVPYSTDLFLPSAFRHPIGIPDSQFPPAWRNYHGYHHSLAAADLRRPQPVPREPS